MTLKKHLGILASPAVPLILLITGLILIQRSMQRRVEEAINDISSPSRLHDAHGSLALPQVKAPSVMATVWVAVLALLAAVACHSCGFLPDSPFPTITAHKIPVSSICKTVECSPAPSVHHLAASRTTTITISPSAPNGIAIGGGQVTNLTVNNYAPPARRLLLSEEDRKKVVAYLAKTPATLALGVLVGDGEAYRFAEDWEELFTDAGWTIKDGKVANMMLMGGFWDGVQLSYRGPKIQPGEEVSVPDSTPEGRVVFVLNKLKCGIGWEPRTRHASRGD